MNLFLYLLLFTAFATQNITSQVKTTIQTNLGTIIIEVDTINAPVSAKNFLHHVKAETFSKGVFYRVLHNENQPLNQHKIEVIQGGLFYDSLIMVHKPVLHETTKITGLKHLDGTVSMARMQPGTASTEFFICIGNQPELDYVGRRNPDGEGFAAFGKVVAGMDVVRKIQSLRDTSQYLVNPVVFQRVKILK
jgi:peptidyl-prolyl cis-trans isomerase A (cyclophilin A)